MVPDSAQTEESGGSILDLDLTPEANRGEEVQMSPDVQGSVLG